MSCGPLSSARRRLDRRDLFYAAVHAAESGSSTDARDREEHCQKIKQIMDDDELPDASDIMFVAVTVSDPSEFES